MKYWPGCGFWLPAMRIFSHRRFRAAAVLVHHRNAELQLVLPHAGYRKERHFVERDGDLDRHKHLPASPALRFAEAHAERFGAGRIAEQQRALDHHRDLGAARHVHIALARAHPVLRITHQPHVDVVDLVVLAPLRLEAEPVVGAGVRHHVGQRRVASRVDHRQAAGCVGQQLERAVLEQLPLLERAGAPGRVAR